MLAATAHSAVAQIQAQLVVSGLSTPVAFVQDPSRPDVQLVVEQGGRIRVVLNGVLTDPDFLDLTTEVLFSGEQGLLGLAFAPDYATSRRIYVNFINKAGDTVISRFLRSSVDPMRADPASRFDLAWPDGRRFIDQPFPNHNGGNLVFGPDGFLYIGLGDGGSGSDPLHMAQDPGTLLGKMLRIDVSVPLSDPKGYVVPATNPFVGQSGVLAEIWAFGYRNPWRYSFDDPTRGGTGAMVVGDVGQSSWEEIDYEAAGAGGRNYGWRNREGAHDHVLSLPPFSLPLTDPIFEYPRTEGQAITGGFVYRGTALGGFYTGRYFFADIIASRIWSLGLTVDPATGDATATDLVDHSVELGSGAIAVSSFGIDSGGELYAVGYGTGKVHRIIAASSPGSPSTCTTVQPASDWICVNGDWLPPGLPLPGAPPPPPSPSTSCTTVQPAPDWTCVNGDWLPPGISGVPTLPPPPPPPPTSTSCITVQPAADWTCVNGDWLPPGISGVPTLPPPPPPSTSCTTVQPAADWTCVNGDWLPPGISGVPTLPPPPPTVCTTVQPAPDWTCVNGDWLPPGLPVPGGG